MKHLVKHKTYSLFHLSQAKNIHHNAFLFIYLVVCLFICFCLEVTNASYLPTSLLTNLADVGDIRL